MITIDLARCNGCGACVEVCPEGALYLVDDKAMGIAFEFEGKRRKQFLCTKHTM